MSDDDEIDPALLRRRQLKERAARRRMLVIIAVGCVIGVVGIIVIASMIFSRSASTTLFGPSTTDEGEKWTFAELRDYLRKKGLPVSMRGSGIAVDFLFVSSAREEEELRDVKSDPRIVFCIRGESAEQVRQLAGADPVNTFAWGRFLFTGKPDRLDAIHKALTGKPFNPRP